MNKSALIIDDYEGDRVLASRILNGAGYDVDTDDGSLYKEKLKQNKYSLVILDVLLGSKTGFDVVPDIKKINPQAYIVMASGCVRHSDRLGDIYSPDIDMFVVKPIGAALIKHMEGVFYAKGS